MLALKAFFGHCPHFFVVLVAFFLVLVAFFDFVVIFLLINPFCQNIDILQLPFTNNVTKDTKKRILSACRILQTW